MRRSTWIPLLGVAIAVVVLFIIFTGSRPDDVAVEGGEVIEGAGSAGGGSADAGSGDPAATVPAAEE
jgi:hypothetical protein